MAAARSKRISVVASSPPFSHRPTTSGPSIFANREQSWLAFNRRVLALAKERGIEVREVKTEKEGDYHTLIRVSVKTDAGERSVAGTLFSNAEPRLVELFGIKVEAELAGHMLYVVNEDAPGFIGRIGTLLGENALNIGTFNLGRREAGGEAVLLLSVDSKVGPELVEQVRKLPGVKRAMALAF